MRTDLWKVPALVLAAAALAAAPPAVRAQDTLAPPAAEAPAAPEQPEGSRIGFNGLTVPKGKVVDGDVVAPFGDVRVDGEVTGDVVVGKGDLILGPQAVVRGDAVVNGGGRLMNEGGRVFGEMRVNSDEEDAARAAALDDETRRDADRAHRSVTEVVHVRRGSSWLGSMGEGARGIVSVLTLGLILAGIGAALIFYALPQLRRVSQVVRDDTWRSAGVGLAANFLSLPAFIVGIVVLAVTIVGIPLLLLYVPLFWVAIGAAAAFGVVAVAHAVGERTAEQSESFSSTRHNAYSYTFTGIAVLLAPLLVAHLLELTGFLGWLGDLVELLANFVLWVAATVGFGAVFLTRGGTREGWPWKPRAAAYDPIFDRDPVLDREMAGRATHV